MDDPEGFRNPKEKEIATKIVDDLRSQLGRIEKINKRNDNETEKDIRSMIKSMSTSLEDKRVRGLREIFSFYSHQHLPEGLEFGDIERKKNILDLGEFLIFTKDFQIPLNKKKIIEIFKKTSSLRQLPVNFEEFCEAVEKIGIEINIERINAIKKRLKELKRIQKEKHLISPEKQRQLELQKKKEEEEKKKAEEVKELPEKDASKEGEDEKESDKKEKEKLESKKSIVTGKSSKSGNNSEEDSESDGKSKITSKTGKTGKTSKSKTDKNSKTGNSDSEEESDDEDPSRPLSMKSKNKSVRFSTIGNSRNKTELHHSDIDEKNRSLDLIPEEGLDIELRNKAKVHPIFVERQKLELELEKYMKKTSEDCHDDIMSILECHDPQKFRKKAKGVLVVPFAMKDFYYRISKDEISMREKKSKMTAAQIK
jgi:hypothetical protein